MWLIDIKDKVILSRKKCCPAHYFPHKFPVGKPVTKEACHFHKAKWRMFHHIFFCNILRCKHYNFMIEKYNKVKKSLKC